MDTQNFFPDFQANQVLTNTQLNQLRQYLDDQTRLSRVRLVGTGIICGLYANLEDNDSIRISAGYGITSDGYIIELKETTYKNYRYYTDPHTVEPEDDLEEPYPVYEPWQTKPIPHQQIDILELLSDEVLEAPEFVEEEDNPAIELTQEVYEDKILVLYLEMLDDPLKSCIVTDCNNKGENIVLTVRALLVNKADLDEVQLCSGKDELVYVPRLISYLQTQGQNLADLKSSSELNTAYTAIYEHTAKQIHIEVSKAYVKYMDVLNLEPEFQSDIDNLQSTLDQVLGTGFNQYHFDFIRDLAKAYNEFAEAVCPLVEKCMFDGDFPRHLMLRDFVEDGGLIGESGKYRHYFVPSPARNVIHEDLEKAQKLFIRILNLAKNQNFGSDDKLKITPGQTLQFKLGERTIPHYYKLEAVENWWQPDHCCALHPPISYEENKMVDNAPLNDLLNPKKHPLHLDPGKFGFYNIEGHLGDQLADTLDKLNKMKKVFNLEFDIITLSFDEINGGFSMQGLEEFKEILAAIEELRKSLETLINQGVNENAEEILSLITDIIAKEESLFELNTDWIDRRRKLKANCDISHLQADYLQLRSELICTYDKIMGALDKIPEYEPPQQQDACVTFDDLEPEQEFDGDEFPSGSLLFEENNIPVTMHEFYWSNGGSGYNWARAIPASPDFGDGNVMWTNNVNLGFDFSDLGFIPNMVSFTYKNDGGNENIKVNNGVRVITSIYSAQGEIAPNVSLKVTLLSETENIYMAALRGDIQTMQLGGQEFSIDQLCAEIRDETIPAYSVKHNTYKAKTINRSITRLEGQYNEAGTNKLKLEFRSRINKLKEEKITLEKVSDISRTGRLLSRDVLLRSSPQVYTRGDASAPGLPPEVRSLQGGSNPMQDLLYGLYLGILDLKAKIKMLISLLPKDVRGFNYLLYSSVAKEIIEQLIRIRLIANFLLDLIVSASGTRASLMRFMSGTLISGIAKNLSELMDFLNAYQRIQYNCFPAQLATVYFQLEHILNMHSLNFGKFAANHPGMEHMAGVSRGGTFIIVGEKAVKNQLVRADFSLQGQVGCCCDIDPEDICLPPIAKIDYQTLEMKINDNGELDDIIKDFDVLKNDLNLDDYTIIPDLVLTEEKSRLGAALSIVEIEGKKLVHYELNEPQIGIDEFSYRIVDVETGCQHSDTGKVILLLRQQTGAPFYAGEDIAVTHVNQPVTVDVALNDVLNRQMLDLNYILNAPQATDYGNTIQVINIENRRQAFYFIPVEGFTGRDQFTYTISFGTVRASGLATVLVIPCCDGNVTQPGIIHGMVYEITLEGLQGALTGATVELMQDNTVIAQQITNKGQFAFTNVTPGTYSLIFNRINPLSGEQTHATVILPDVTVNSGQTLTLEPVFMQELEQGQAVFNPPEFIGDITLLTENLGSIAGIEKTEAEALVFEVLVPRKTLRIEVVEEIAGSDIVKDEAALEKVTELVSTIIEKEGKSGEDIAMEYLETTNLLLENYEVAIGEEKETYKTLIKTVAGSMLDDITTAELTEISTGTEEVLKEVAANLKNANISLKTLKSNWKSNELKNKLKLPAVTRMNKIFK